MSFIHFYFPVRKVAAWPALFLVTAMVLLSLVSCKPSVPSQYIQKGKMENILYDYHLAKAMFAQMGTDSLTLLAYQESILRKYEVTRAEFDSSLVYYTRHAQLLHEIYEHLSDRLSQDIVAQGGVATGLGQYGDNIAGADTASIWHGDRSFVLTPFAAANTYSFEAKADTSFHKGDRIILDFDAQFIYQDGMRDATAVMAVTYTNDSVHTEVARISSSSHYHLQVEDSGMLGVKAVKGYFLLSNGSTGYSSTIRVCVCYNVKMLRMHVRRETGADTPSADTVKAPRPDTMRVRTTVASQPIPTAKPPVAGKAVPSREGGGKPAAADRPDMPVRPVQPLKPIKNMNLKDVKPIIKQ